MPARYRFLPAGLLPTSLLLASLVLVFLALALALGGCRRARPVELEVPVRFGQAAAEEAAGGGERGGIEAADAVLLYRRGDRPCEVLLAGTAGLAAGPCGGELSPRVYARPERVERIQELAFTYTSFELESDEEELEFHGVGERVPSPAEQRMVLELARRLMTESLGLRRAEAYRLAFAWHRQGSGEQPCDDLAIYLSGEAVATSCAYRGVEVTGSLTPEQLARVYGWVDRLRPFQVQGGGGAAANGGERDASSIRLIFVGRGDEPGEDAVGEISRFAQEIYRAMTDVELVRLAAEREREEERRLLEAQQAAGLVPPPTGPGRQGQPSQGQPGPPVQPGQGPAAGQGQPAGQGQGQPPAAAPLPPPEPEPPPPPAVGVEEQVADPDADADDGPEEDDGGNGDAEADPEDDDGGGGA